MPGHFRMVGKCLLGCQLPSLTAQELAALRASPPCPQGSLAGLDPADY